MSLDDLEYDVVSYLNDSVQAAPRCLMKLLQKTRTSRRKNQSYSIVPRLVSVGECGLTSENVSAQ